MKSYDEHLAEQVSGEIICAGDDHVVADRATAERYLRAHRYLAGEQERIKAQMTQEIAGVKAFYTQQMDAIAMRLRAVDGLLESYLLAEHTLHPSTKSLNLAAGKLQLRESTQYTHDETVLLPWARQADPDTLVKVEESLRWAEVKKRLTPLETGEAVDKVSGEIVPGVSCTRELTFSVSTHTTGVEDLELDIQATQAIPLAPAPVATPTDTLDLFD